MTETPLGEIDLRRRIREVDDFPTPGVNFKDITPLLADPRALRQTINGLAEWATAKQADVIVGAEARGFILGAAIAAQAGCGFVPAVTLAGSRSSGLLGMQERVLLLGGSIAFESAPGAGTVVVAELPLSASAAFEA